MRQELLINKRLRMRIEGKRHKELEIENKKKEKDWRESMDVVVSQYGNKGWYEELKFR